MAMECCVCEDVLLHVDEVEELQKSKKTVSLARCRAVIARIVLGGSWEAPSGFTPKKR
jgi:hypothetical protein